MSLRLLLLQREDLKVLIYLNLYIKPLNGNIVLDVLKIWEYPLPEKEKLKN